MAVSICVLRLNTIASDRVLFQEVCYENERGLVLYMLKVYDCFFLCVSHVIFICVIYTIRQSCLLILQNCVWKKTVTLL